MKAQRKSSLLLAGMAGAAVVTASVMVAPAAAARASCDEVGGTTICQRNSGSVSIKATPGTVAGPAYARNQTPWQPGSQPILGGIR